MLPPHLDEFHLIDQHPSERIVSTIIALWKVTIFSLISFSLTCVARPFFCWSGPVVECNVLDVT